jgi:DNA-binding transcriptional MerR regulator
VIEQKDTVIKQISIENKERLYHIIQRMLKKGMSWKTIREITGFSNEEIEQIIDNIKRDNNNKEV